MPRLMRKRGSRDAAADEEREDLEMPQLTRKSESRDAEALAEVADCTTLAICFDNNSI